MILPLALQNIGCQSRPLFESSGSATVTIGTAEIHVEWSYTEGGSSSAPKPTPGSNQGTAPNGAEAKNPTSSISTPNPVSIDGTVSNDSSVISGSSTLEDGSTWNGTMATAPNYTGDHVVYESHYGAY